MAKKTGEFELPVAIRIGRMLRKFEHQAQRPPVHHPIAAPIEDDFDAIFLAKPDAAIAAGASGTVSLWRDDGSGEVDTTDNVTAINWSTAAVALDDRVVVVRERISEKYYICGNGSQTEIGTVDSWTGSGPTSSGIISIFRGAGGSEVDSTTNITAFGWLLSTGQVIGAGINVTIAKNPSGVWYVTGSACP